jgi:hypothetical protein
MNFDRDQIRRLIRGMTPRSAFYRLLRDELKAIGRWRNKPRGKPPEKRRYTEVDGKHSHPVQRGRAA